MNAMIGLSIIVAMYLATIVYFMVDMTIEIIKMNKAPKKRKHLEIVLTDIPDVYAVWNINENDYEFSGTYQECKEFINNN